jgi:hypothetical protein
MLRLAPLIVAALSALAGCSGAIGGADYSPAYDFGEFYAATDGKAFRVVVSGNPFPALAPDQVKRRLLPVMQANRPRPRLTFTYDVPAELPHPDYRLVMVFDAAPDLTAARACAGEFRHRAQPSGHFELFAIYCRNELALSQAAVSMAAASPEDPKVGQRFSQLFLVLFTEFRPIRRPLPPFVLRRW